MYKLNVGCQNQSLQCLGIKKSKYLLEKKKINEYIKNNR
jgi:hypothetical protein